MSDLIDRQAAIDIFQNLAYDDWNQGAGTTWANAYSEAAEMVRTMPSAEPECKTGRWETAMLDHEAFGVRPKVLYCSECNQCIAYPTRYCPNCGAHMEVEHAEV